MKTFVALALAGSAVAQGVTSAIAPEAPAPSGCEPSADGSFQVSVVNVTTSAKKRGVERRQLAGTLTVTLQDGVMTDQADRTAYIAANYQWQFDAPPQTGAIYTSGFSLCSNNSFALGGSAIFYQCYTGGFYNIYDRHWAEQCSPIYLVAVSSGTVTQTSDGQPGVTSAVTQISDGQPQQPTGGVTQISDGQPQAPTGVISQISDGQPQAPTGVISQISDGQPQAPTGVISQISDGQPQAPTGVITQISDGQPQAPTGVITQISDGQPQAPTGIITQISDGQPQAPTGPVITQISDGQPQAPTGPVITQISDGQPQAPTEAPTSFISQISDGQPQAPVATNATGNYSATQSAPPEYTGAAATPVYGVGAFAAGLLGLAALL